jgi:hypothetical protein
MEFTWRFVWPAQIIAAAALCLALSVSASASLRGGENFAMAHLRQSGRD